MGEILFLWPHLHTGRVVASSQTSAVLHNTVQTEEEKRRLMIRFPIVVLYLYLILLFLMSTLGMARLVEEQKGAGCHGTEMLIGLLGKREICL